MQLALHGDELILLDRKRAKLSWIRMRVRRTREAGMVITSSPPAGLAYCQLDWARPAGEPSAAFHIRFCLGNSPATYEPVLPLKPSLVGAAPADPMVRQLAGIWCGTYGPHGDELLQMRFDRDEVRVCMGGGDGVVQ